MPKHRVCDLPRRQRDKFVHWCIEITRHLWDSTPNGALAHAVWSQMLKDMGQSERAREKAIWDWVATDDHWFIEGHGLNRYYLNQMLEKWGYTDAQSACQ